MEAEHDRKNIKMTHAEREGEKERRFHYCKPIIDDLRSI
jgi:hypothetical protein